MQRQFTHCRRREGMLNWKSFLPSLPTCVGCACENEDEHSQVVQAQSGLPGNANNFDIYVPVPVSSCAPKVRGFPTYSSAPDQPLLGVPIREGCLWHLSTQDHFEPVTFHLYVNGFAFSTADGLEASLSLSPFSLVRNCRFQSGECAKLKSFKVSLLDHDPCCYFAIRGPPESEPSERESEEERSEWVLGISHTILLITDSLLPRYGVSCDPVSHQPHTQLRLLAGYLIHRDDAGSISVLFCELHAQRGNTAKLFMYENEECHSSVMDIVITQNSVCCDIVGINCSCFIVECHHFAAQTPSERKLWLRALSNVKVKIQNGAPEPTVEEMEHYRESIREQIHCLEATLDPRISRSALLSRRARRSLQPVGDGDVDDEPQPANGVGEVHAEPEGTLDLPKGSPADDVGEPVSNVKESNGVKYQVNL